MTTRWGYAEDVLAGTAAVDAKTAAGPHGGARLPAGGVFGLWRTTGHYEVTQETAERFGFTSPAVRILRDAAQDADFYEWGTPAAHAQTPDAAGRLPRGEARDAAVAAAQAAFQKWVKDRLALAAARLRAGDVRGALYFLGYLLHAVEDLAPHAGRTNEEHAAEEAQGDNPDHDPAAVELARHYGFRMLRAVRDSLGGDAFDLMRNWTGEGTLTPKEKRALLGHGRDVGPGPLLAYKKAGAAYAALDPAPEPVRWPRELVLGALLQDISDPTRPRARTRKAAAAPKGRGKAAAAPLAVVHQEKGFEPLVPRRKPGRTAEWAVLVYMAGDDANPDGIEYAVRQDLEELKRVGSSDQVHLLVQTDEWTRRNSFRYRLRNDTPLDADQLEVFRGDLNTGRISTLVDFVRWAQERFTAERYALVLWGHGSGHDDRDVYRLARGVVSPRLAAQLARRRLGFFGGTRRNLLERGGPARGFGFDDTAADFLDDVEMRAALQRISDVLKRPLDLLGFDACLMAMMEVAYQARDTAGVMVASQRAEPGDGWGYADAFRILRDEPTLDAEGLAKRIVQVYAAQYGGAQTLSALRMRELAHLADELKALSAGLVQRARSDDEARRLFDEARRAATDCSPPIGQGYRDLGTFLEALGDPGARARAKLRDTVIEASGDLTSGLSVYLPGDYRPEEPGGTDELYERLDFAQACGWSKLLRTMLAPRPARPVSRRPAPASPRGSLYALDRHNAPTLLPALVDGVVDEGDDRGGDRWPDRARLKILEPVRHLAEVALDRLRHEDANGDLRVYVLPGIMASQLSDRRGHHGLMWIDPVGLAIGSDFEALRRTPDGRTDADAAVRIEATHPLPVLYDRLSLALLAQFGPVVEQVGFDWRLPISVVADAFARRLQLSLKANPGRKVAFVGHSMGGLVAAHAFARLGALQSRVLGLAALGTPWLGSFQAVLSLRGEGREVRSFAALTNRLPRAVTDVVQTFWGLTDLLPPERPDLQDPTLYAPGPLPRSATGPAQLRGADALLRELRPRKGAPPLLPPRTVAVVCHSKTTTVDVSVHDGEIEPDAGPGDGTVPAESATFGGAIHDVVVVNQDHSTLPLDGPAIDAVVNRIGAWVHGRAWGSTFSVGRLPVLDRTAPRDRDVFLSRLEDVDRKALSIGDLLPLMPLL
ncbi:MAG TPA: alpha/beta fold hydrolase [Myxococcota bacterium]|jgi:hypothetical protein|nr:alpha/beta fold hydrolase [Myxococcota bacterium]